MINMAPSEGLRVHESNSSTAPSEERDYSVRSDSSLSDYCLPWLFDPHRHDHLPIEQQLDFYKKRDLRKVKIFKIATQIWGAPLQRKRVIKAPRMYGGSSQGGERKAPPMNEQLRPQVPPVIPPTEAEVKAWEQQAKIDDYKNWVKERKDFRHELDSMGLNEEWLARKPDKTPLENRVLRRLVEERTPKKTLPPPVVEEPLEAILPEESPIVKRPSPLAIRIIEQFLLEKRLRLLDLFTTVDKDKNWKVSRDEFRLAVQKAKIPISEVLLEDLILSLDADLNDELDYRELAKGMGLWKVEKRESKRKMLASNITSAAKLSQLSGFETPEPQPSLESITPVSRFRQQDDDVFEAADDVPPSPSPIPPGRVKSALSTISSSSSFLGVPAKDMRPEKMVHASEEAMLDERKRSRDVLHRLKGKTSLQEKNKDQSKTVIKTGDKAIDDHSMLSTMGGETADLVNKFRRLKLKEYEDIRALCEINNIPLTRQLLSKVLLYPPDKTHIRLRKHIRQPAMPLHTSNFADPPKKPKSPPESQKLKGNERNAKSSKSKNVLPNQKNALPQADDVAPVPTKMQLSTGKAYIYRKVDCWLSFEDYDKLTKNMATKYTELYGNTDDNAFWPGHLLDKIRLHMPNQNVKKTSVFTVIQPTTNVYAGHNPKMGWPMNESGYVQSAPVDSYALKNV